MKVNKLITLLQNIENQNLDVCVENPDFDESVNYWVVTIDNAGDHIVLGVSE